jgi:DNA-3-methyladenine glycosylase
MKSKDQTALDRSFFRRDALQVAQDLLGRVMHFGGTKLIITETEAYLGHKDDPACHASRGITPRNRIMFADGGFSYVYLIYGVHYCLNFVTEEPGFGAAVLIRGGVLVTDNFQKPEIDLTGPGKLTRYLGINSSHNGLDLVAGKELFMSRAKNNIDYIATPRIGISKAKDKFWRFIDQSRVNHKKLARQINV